MQFPRYLKGCLFGLSIFAISHGHGQKFSWTSISDSIKNNADAVVRLEENILNVKSASSATFNVHRVVTVLNKKGEKSAQFTILYDKFIMPSSIKITIYDAAGIVTKKVKESEIGDYSYDASALFSDNRIKIFKPCVIKYPYSVEVNYELEYKGYIGLPGWSPVDIYNLSVEHSCYALNIGTDADIKYKELNLTGQNAVTEENGIKTILWQLDNFIAIDEEPGSPSIEEYTPGVIVAANHFFYDGYPGSLDSWENYNNWIIRLNQDRGELPELTIQKIHALTDTIIDPYQKAKVLYEYLQMRMRYISIQLGIGGFQPFTAETVDKVGYGDCKALSNYYLALLREAGITAFYTLAIHHPAIPVFYYDFPANIYFNHVIVCIPFGSDTIWAECTNKYFPLGHLSSSVAGHPALIVTPEGGKIVATPKSPGERNILSRKSEISLNEDGKGNIILETIYSGLQLYEGFGICVQSIEDQRKNLYEDLNFIDFNIESHRYFYQKSENPFVRLNAVISCNRLATLSGHRMFIPVNPLSDEIDIPEKVENRKTSFIIDFPYMDIDSIEMLLPQNYAIESLPRNSKIESEFGTYELSVNISEGKIIIVSQMKMNSGVFVSSEYDRYRSFLSDINKGENQKIIFKKITTTN